MQLVYADALGERTLEMPRAGPSGGSCAEITHGQRQFPNWIRVFKDQDNISALGIVFGEDDFFKLGKPSSDSMKLDIEPGHHIVGFYGATGDESMTQLGLITEDVACSTNFRMEEAEQQMKMDAENDSGMGALLIITIIFAVLVGVGILLVIAYFVLKHVQKRVSSRVQVLKKTTVSSSSPAKVHREQSLPNVNVDT